MPKLQRIVQRGRRVIPRGWTPLLRLCASVNPSLRTYPAHMQNGETMYLDMREKMCHGYFFHGEVRHERGTEVLLRKVLGQGSTFVDIGANLGYYTRVASRLVGEQGQVHSFDPMPMVFSLLQKNTQDLCNVKLHNVALSNSHGKMHFSVRDKGDMSSLGDDSSAKEVITVETITMDQALRDTKRIDLIKMDVEGFELEVLQGARQSILDHHPVVYFEHLQHYLDDRGQRYAHFESFFGDLGYKLEYINHETPEAQITSEKPATYIVAMPIEYRIRD